MSKTSKKKSQQKKQAAQALPNQPWISMKSGLRVMWIASIGMAVLTAWQVIPQKGWVLGIVYGLIFGALIWLVFWGYYFLNRLLRRKNE